jgi:hypothetical protein
VNGNLGAPHGCGDERCPDRLLLHCHSTWLVHVDTGACTDDDCEMPAEAHALSITCAAVGCPCST